MARRPSSCALLLWCLLLLQAPTFAQAPGQPVALPRGEIVEKVVTLAEPGQHYALFLPADYSADRRWPVMILLDARGRGASTLELAEPGARANGWIVLSSYQSQSDVDENITLRALQALLREVGQRFAYDPKRIYLAGFSGTAKTLWTQAGPLRNVIAGLLGSSGARPPELGASMHLPPAFFGTAGTADFNFQEMRELDEALSRANATRRLAVFEGAHAWPPASVFTEAMEWFDLMAMRDGRLPRNAGWIDGRFNAEFDSARREARPLVRWRRLDQLVRDFQGMRDVSAVKADAEALRQQAEVRDALKQEARLRSDERSSSQRLDAWILRVDQRDPATGSPSEPPDKGTALRELRVASLKAMAADQADAALSASARRRLERIGVATGFYLPRRYLARGDHARAAAVLDIAVAIFPDRAVTHWQLAQARAGMGRKEQAFAALADARRLGYVDAESMKADPVWASLRQDPRWVSASAPLP